jgi:predicted RND superfamily exporter protein
MHKAAAELDFFDVAYFAERSIEDEIDATTESDLIIFIISYALIFLYITVALGKYTSLKRIPVDMKVSLATGGIIIILASALAATGVFGWARVASNLIVMEVVPFLILAVGADNVFILVMDIQREERKHRKVTFQNILYHFH